MSSVELNIERFKVSPAASKMHKTSPYRPNEKGHKAEIQRTAESQSIREKCCPFKTRLGSIRFGRKRSKQT